MKSLTGNSIWHGLALLALCILLALPPVQADNRIRVSVTAFDNKVKGIFGNWSLGEGLAEMLTTELVNTGRFIVLERMAITDVLAEQELAQSGLVRSAGAPRTGGMLGAQVIVRGAVTEFSDAVSGYGGGLGYKGFGISGKSQKAVVGIDLRLIDASSGQVLASQHVTKDAQSSGGKINYSNADFRIGGGAFSRTPLGQAARAAISDAVTFVGRNTNLQLSSGATAPGLKIVKADATRIYINAGANQGISTGSSYDVYTAGESLVDPDTGLELGSTEELIGTVEVTTVKDKYAIATIVRGGGFKRGDLLRAR